MPRAVIGSFYRMNTLRLHPDKNRHPMANQAFQKFADCYQHCVRDNKNG